MFFISFHGTNSPYDLKSKRIIFLGNIFSYSSTFLRKCRISLYFGDQDIILFDLNIMFFTRGGGVGPSGNPVWDPSTGWPGLRRIGFRWERVANDWETPADPSA